VKLGCLRLHGTRQHKSPVMPATEASPSDKLTATGWPRSSDECRPLTIGGVRVPPQGWGADKDGTVPAADGLAGSPARGSSRPCPPRSSAFARTFDTSLNLGDEQSDIVQGHLVESRANPSLVQIDHVVDQVIICHREPRPSEPAMCSAVTRLTQLGEAKLPQHYFSCACVVHRTD